MDFSGYSPEIDQPKNTGIYPKFYTRAVQNQRASLEEGRPIYDEVEWVDIIIAGDRNNKPSRKVSDQDRSRWPAEYRRFKEGKEEAAQGTPLEKWPALTITQVEELKHFNLRSVEDLINVPDDALSRLGMGARELQKKAKAFIEYSKDSGVIQRYVDENEKLKTQVSGLSEKLDTLTEQIKVLAERRPPGAPTKEEREIIKKVKSQ